MTGDLLAIGASHKTAPLELREKLALPDTRAARALAELVDHDSIHEAVAISTCTRTEFHMVVAHAAEPEKAALSIMSRRTAIRTPALEGAIYALRTWER